MVAIQFFTRVGCHLCESAESILRKELDSTPFQLMVFDIDQNQELRDLYNTLVPVTILPSGEEMHYRVDPARVREALAEAIALTPARR